MANVNFRSANQNDIPKIVDFQVRMAMETEKLKLDPDTCRQGVRAVFSRPTLGTYHVCANGPELIGALLITPEWSDWRNGLVWWIHSVYIEPACRGQGHFRRFYTYIKKLAEADSLIRGIRLYVDHSNESAQAVYKKIGMNGDHYRLFEWMKTF